MKENGGGRATEGLLVRADRAEAPIGDPARDLHGDELRDDVARRGDAEAAAQPELDLREAHFARVGTRRFSAVKRPAPPYKRTIQNRVTVRNVKAA